MQIRRATLDDTRAISQLFCAGIERWQRLDSGGQVQDLPYEALTIYERWLHGGAWMSVETGAIWLSHLLSGAGLPYVVEDTNGIIGYVEAYTSNEPAPYRNHLHIGYIVTAREAPDSVSDLLMQHALEQASKIGRVSAACTSYDDEALQFYQRYGLKQIDQIEQLSLPAQGGNVGFYKVSDHPDIAASQIAGWHMPVGRTESARYHWEHLWPNLWQAVPRIIERRMHRRHFNAAGHEAFVCSHQQLYDPRTAEIYCWTPKPLSTQLMSAIRDWAYKQGYRTLILTVTEKTAVLLGSQAEKTPYQQTILARDV